MYGLHLNIFASLYYTKGRAYLHLDLLDKAKANFTSSLKCDPRCFDSLDAMISAQLLTLQEETDLISSFESKGLEMELDLIKSIYTCRLTKVIKFINN
jgi:hypothetical protein